MRRRFPGFMFPTTRLRDKMPAQEHTYPLVNVYWWFSGGLMGFDGNISSGKRLHHYGKIHHAING